MCSSLCILCRYRLAVKSIVTALSFFRISSLTSIFAE